MTAAAPDPRFFVERAMSQENYGAAHPTRVRNLRIGDLVYRPPRGRRCGTDGSFPPRRNTWYVVGLRPILADMSSMWVAFHGLWPCRRYPIDAVIPRVRRADEPRTFECAHLSGTARVIECGVCGVLA